MEKNNPDVASVRANSKNEAQPEFKETTVPAVRFWFLSVG